jgi:hypothetical protein
VTYFGAQRGQHPSRGAWRALQQTFSLAFAICCVSEVTPLFIISVVLEVLETEAREA